MSSMTSPTVIYMYPLVDGFVSVTDVSGTYYVQEYNVNNKNNEYGSANTNYVHGETWSSGEDAVKCAEKIVELAVQAEWEKR